MVFNTWVLTCLWGTAGQCGEGQIYDIAADDRGLQKARAWVLQREQLSLVDRIVPTFYLHVYLPSSLGEAEDMGEAAEVL